MKLIILRPLQAVFTRVKTIQSQVVRRYLIASVLSVVLDFFLFQVILSETASSIPISLILGRMVSMTFNYALLKGWVFESQQSVVQSFPKYLVLVLINLALTTTFTTSIAEFFHIAPLLAKFIGDSITYCLIFLVNRFIIFNR